MARTRTFDEQKALTDAMHVFWEKGYEAASLIDLTSRMGIQKPSMYAAFGDKMALFESALRHYNQLHAKAVRTKLTNSDSDSVKSAFRRLFMEGVFPAATDERHGCFCINTMVELGPHDARFEVLTREHQRYLATIFEDALKQGISSGELDGTMDCPAAAQSLVVAFIGITVLKKANPDRQWLESCIDAALSVLSTRPRL
ncbi:TetR family transcriptional regulator [Paenibacillus sp. 598K]|uniref:TetR/AcrR family transcriptional regulator n=1 Tax=Paenibacillus sp. 598K TaxID=1117987 RepID=UPI000FFA76DB|nr:TetR/AcrR family transcriptional regulator [Paenibacillus sp. 598K]GBF78179.1 TetR family transcriptional regulator [Paenibacillus sp. 598K]